MKKIIYKIITFFFGSYGDRFIKKVKHFFSLNWLRDNLNKRTIHIGRKDNLYFRVWDVGKASSIRARKFFRSEPDTIQFIDSFKSNSNFIDCGANIGLYSLYAATKGHNVISFEPESANFYLLNSNILLNKFSDKIKAYPISLSNKNTIDYLYMSKYELGESGHTFGRNQDYNLNKFEPEFIQGSIAITLDKFCIQKKFDIDYMKIDVDGNELRVIEGMLEIIKSKNIKKILVELNLNLREHQKVIEILRTNDYQVIQKTKNKLNENLIFSIKN